MIPPPDPVTTFPAEGPPAPARPDPADQDPPLPDYLRVLPWTDPVIDALGHDPRSRYVEQYWLGILGPSTTWLLRRLADGFDGEPSGFELALHETATELGLGMRSGRRSPFMRSIDRACQFGMARHGDGNDLHVRRFLPPLTQGQLKRLPPGAQEAHEHWRRAQLSDDPDQERRARRLALALLEVGESPPVARRHLRSWSVDSKIAERALEWAHDRHMAASKAAGID